MVASSTPSAPADILAESSCWDLRTESGRVVESSANGPAREAQVAPSAARPGGAPEAACGVARGAVSVGTADETANGPAKGAEMGGNPAIVREGGGIAGAR